MRLLRTLARGRGTTSRRQLLRALGVSAAAAPFVPALDGWAAAGAAGPRRLVLLFSPHGVIPETYWPTGTETSFSFPANGILEPLAAHKKDMIVFRGLKRPTQGRGEHERCMCNLWTGSRMAEPTQDASSASVDQIIAKALKPQTSFESLQLGVQCAYWAEGDVSKTNSPNSSMINAGAHERIYPENDPYKAFDRLFVAPGAPADTMAGERVRARRQSVLDFVKDELEDLNRVVGQPDRLKIQSHLDATRDVERRLQEPMRLCGAATRPDGTMDLAANENHPKIIPLMNALMVAALACDRTRIASMQYSRSFSNQKHSWVGANDGHHSISHKPAATAILTAIQRWYMGHFAGLLDAFRAVDEAGTPMLDNMLVAYCAELYTPWNHVAEPSPCFLVGKAGGAVRTGRLLDYGNNNDHNQFLTTICHAMGATGINKVGDLGKEGILPNVLA